MTMRFYKGSLSYSDILEMPYSTFMMFYEYMEYLMNMETEDGQKRNKKADNQLEANLGIETIGDDLNKLKSMFK